MFERIKHDAAEAARKTALTLVGAVFGTVGLAFLTVAAWLVLAEIQTTQFAALVIGLAYLGVAGVLIALASSGRSKPPVPVAPAVPENPMASVIAAFLQGAQAGAQTGASSARRP
ncbi:hypothetical protein AQS8620_00230 [Aquimixticola soesokkakensis]|uniref:Holin-X, holin superfamily III n=1 Tax=Aquimixticola soesokkakensis TaxID=1519096 RepID=A0A1Y5RCR5_9RHOB|nr:phage holin family protein [Aquimixticola soesokkakensis]SLN14428.1 hypothetical protein AQS8620_00230 [Aquimixticola soesokkakensis]